MEVKQYYSVRDFLKENLTFLEQEEAVNNLLIGIPFSIMGRNEQAHLPNLFSVLNDSGAVVFTLVHTPPQNFLIYGKGPESILAIETLIPFLKDKNLKTSGVIGSKDLAISFAEAWKRQTQQAWKVNFEQLIYQLDKIKPIPLSRGKLRKAYPNDLPIVKNWFVNFAKEAMNSDDAEKAMTIGKAKIESGTLYLWEDQEIVSMAAIARPTRNGITVNYVYSPPEYRGKGYASSCVASMSERMLKHYNFCSLFTDMTNPTSNKIYQKMGYNPIQEFREIHFL